MTKVAWHTCRLKFNLLSLFLVLILNMYSELITFLVLYSWNDYRFHLLSQFSLFTNGKKKYEASSERGLCFINSNCHMSCLSLCDPLDYTPPGSSVPGILQARMLEWVAIPEKGILPTQGSNQCLLHCRQMLYYLSY